MVRSTALALLAAGLLVALSCSPPPLAIDSGWQIIVGCATFSSPQEAAQAEAQIDWSSNDLDRMNACTEGFAAQELHTYLGRLSGLEPSDSAFAVICLAENLPPHAIVLTDLSQPANHPAVAAAIAKQRLQESLTAAESYAIFLHHGRLFIVGRDRVGTLYGVYHFLETLGVRWYAPAADGEHIPSRKQLVFPPRKKIISAPQFITRGFWAWEDRGNPDFYLWMARNRLNYWTTAEPDRPFLRKLGMHLTYGGHEHFHRFLNPDGDYLYNHPLFRGDERKPADPYRISASEYRGDTNLDGHLTYFEAHPEWYGLVAGKRTPFKGEFGTNICTSNSDAIDHLLKGLVAELAEGEWRDAGSINFWPIDGGKWCECENCTPLGNPTDRLLLLVHQLQEAIEAARANGRIKRPIGIVFPIYHETLVPPSRPLPEGFDYHTCIGTYFPILRCYVHSIDDTTCTEYNVPLWNALLDWTQGEPRYYQGQFFVGEYYNVSKIKSLPVLYTRILAHEIPLYFSQGVRHFHYMHVNTRLWGMKRLNNYLLAKLLWDPQADVERLTSAYFDDFYAPVAEEMRRLTAQLETALSNVRQVRDWQHLPDRINQDLDPLFHRQHLQLEETHSAMNDGVDLAESVAAMHACREIMDSLLQKDLPPLLRDRLLEDDQNLRYGANTVFFYDAVIRAILAERAGDLASARHQLERSIPYARALRAETAIVQTASSHANAADGLAATGIEETYRKMIGRLLPGFVLE